VVGRRGVSKRQEFLFGSVSSKVVRDAKNCAVWVIE
jgi:nucleotide-binding universal stress UspA family protein